MRYQLTFDVPAGNGRWQLMRSNRNNYRPDFDGTVNCGRLLPTSCLSTTGLVVAMVHRRYKSPRGHPNVIEKQRRIEFLWRKLAGDITVTSSAKQRM